MSLLIIDNYDSFTFNLYQMLQEQTEMEVVVKRNDALTIDEVRELAPRGIVLSPGPGHPSNRRDFGVCADVIERSASLNCPVLGVCLGHQGLAHYLGGSVKRAPAILHGKTSTITLTSPSRLFHRLPPKFSAMRYHSLVVLDDDLPDCLEVVARDERDGLIMALQHKSLPLYGVQFHPESIGTPDGNIILKNFIELCSNL